MANAYWKAGDVFWSHVVVQYITGIQVVSGSSDKTVQVWDVVFESLVKSS